MARIPEAEIERIKQEVSLERLVGITGTDFIVDGGILAAYVTPE